MMRRALNGLTVLVLVTLPAGAEEEPPRAPWLSGTADVRLDAERSRNDTDIELDTFLRLEGAPASHPKLKLRAGVWAHGDLDGHESETSALRGLLDTYGASVQLRLLYLYLEMDDPWGDSTLRLGRQRIHEGIAHNLIDGVYFKKRQAAWDWYAFAGFRASLYRDTGGDAALGAGVGVTPWKSGRIAADVFYGEEHRESSEEVRRGPIYDLLGLGFPRRVRTRLDSRAVALSLTQRLGPRHTLFGKYTWYDGSGNEVMLNATGAFTRRDVVYTLTYRQRLQLLSDRTNDVTGFYRVLGPFEEFSEINGTLSIPFGERVTLALTGQWHDAKDDTPFGANRDFVRGMASLTSEKLFKGWTPTVGVERWDVEDGEGTWALTGEIERAWARLKLGFGVDFARYEDRLIDYRSGLLAANQIIVALAPAIFPGYRPLVTLFDTAVIETHENIHTFYARMKYAMKKDQEFSARFSVEEDDSRDSPYWRLEATYTVRF